MTALIWPGVRISPISRCRKGFTYLAALIDIYSRYIVAWEVSVSLEADGYVQMLRRALRYKTPDVINSDQGKQFTFDGWIETLIAFGVKISMNSKGRCADNAHIERFWRSVKHESVYLEPPESMVELRCNLKAYMTFYNEERPHQALDYAKPIELYRGQNVALSTKKKVAKKKKKKGVL